MKLYMTTARKVLVVIFAVTAALATPGHAQQHPDTPLAEISSEETNYPDGRRLHATYETFKGGVEV
jgi:hypothetical protein